MGGGSTQRTGKRVGIAQSEGDRWDDTELCSPAMRQTPLVLALALPIAGMQTPTDYLPGNAALL